MTDFDLLSAVQPSGGWFAVVGIKEGFAPKQVMVTSREEVGVISEQFVANGRNAFFGLASYKTDKGRTKDNVKELKAFWLDLDCGEGKPYADQPEAAEALRGFIKHIGLPRPIVVDSGRGLHVYWPLTEAISRGEWEDISDRLKQLCNIHTLYADPACFEAARILRIPGTYNFKGDTPVEVTVLTQGSGATTPYDLRKILGVEEEISGIFNTPKRSAPSYLQRKLADNNEYHFDRVLKRSLDGTGCNQIKDYYENRETADYDTWFRALTVAASCDDKATAIHAISEGHEGYDPATTETKAAGLSFATSCVKFEAANPDGCKNCPHKGRIGSPKRLGIIVPEATEDDNVVVQEDAEGVVDTYIIPPFPDPYYRGKNGGIYRRPPPGAEEVEPIFVYGNDLYVVKRMEDPDEGDVVVLRLHMPTDGVRQFTVSNSKLFDATEIRKILASKGVVANKKRFDLLVEYIQLSVEELQHRKKAEQMRLQFGWADNNSKFIVGETEYSADGDFHSPPSAVTKGIAQFLGPVGSLEKWQEVFNLYGQPGLEAHAFAALTAFGAPLLKFLGQSGAFINLIHPTSGTGKTTILRMCNSVWGSPDRLCSIKDDTLNARMLRMGVHNNLPVTIDEITNMKAEEFSAFVYAGSQGRGKDRVKASSNELRHNATTWQTIMLCSSNASFYEKLGVLKTSPDGEMMRVIEYKIEPSTIIAPDVAKSMFDHQLAQNYGHAGQIYARWLVNNLEEAKEGALGLQAKIDRELQLTSRERFWSALVAANLTGGLIMKQRLKLIPEWNMKNIYDFAGNLIGSMRNEAVAPVNDAVQVVGDYINRHIQNVLVVKDAADRRTNMQDAPIREPKGELLIRFEPDTKLLFLTVKAFRDDCVRKQINYKDTLAELKQKGILLDTKNKRVTKGMAVTFPGVTSHILDTNNPDFIDLSSIATPEDKDAGGGS